MPNLKIFVDEALLPERRAALTQALGPIRALLCRELAVPPAACQLAVVPVIALPDQPPVNAELHILPRPERTRARVEALCAAALDPETYVALK